MDKRMGFQQLIKFLLQSLQGAQYAISRNYVNSLAIHTKVCDCYKQKRVRQGSLGCTGEEHVFVNTMNIVQSRPCYTKTNNKCFLYHTVQLLLYTHSLQTVS